MKLEMNTTFNRELPVTYLKFLNENPDGCQIKNNGRWDKRTWNMFGKAALLERWEMKGVGEAANYECLKLYTYIQEEVGEIAYAPSLRFGRVKLERVAKGFVIGTENGDYLYLDPDCSFSVWAYYHDGGEVTKISGSFADFYKTRKPL
ncbi:SMI1/KNR4 family protein [Salegentibacter maritimus]|uniref:SMI1/KNR4 family protein n=1 Tax=Salegentibacter maritimus TaxID=2794347 RepID=A0ABS0TKV7_9FLAO|nr:SMI1/KNR4 family protein [Salegentibacter maritimus]MBI6120851.1 SMI1/KNR4 family protein [Salegentibacter maritimus]